MSVVCINEVFVISGLILYTKYDLFVETNEIVCNIGVPFERGSTVLRQFILPSNNLYELPATAELKDSMLEAAVFYQVYLHGRSQIKCM